ncbi:MAG: hypothetical protein HQL58_01900 [Magnetococcales bacterium]|nr:hypothetical protein [Magnetococcales bacterium]
MATTASSFSGTYFGTDSDNSVWQMVITTTGGITGAGFDWDGTRYPFTGSMSINSQGAFTTTLKFGDSSTTRLNGTVHPTSYSVSGSFADSDGTTGTFQGVRAQVAAQFIGTYSGTDSDGSRWSIAFAANGNATGSVSHPDGSRYSPTGLMSVNSSGVLTGMLLDSGGVTMLSGTVDPTRYTVEGSFVADEGGHGTFQGKKEGTTLPQTLTAPTNLDLAAVDDSGVSSSDNITKNSRGLTISGIGKKGSVVMLFDDKDNNSQLDSGESLGTIAITAATGKWNKDIALASGAHNIRAMHWKGGASVSAASDALMITIDTTPPTTAPSAPVLDSDDDIGARDNVTTRSKGLNFSGTADIGALVTLFEDKNKNKKQDSAEKALATVTADNDGNWRTNDLALALGAHSLYAFQSDAAGNASVSSGVLALTISKTAKQAELREGSGLLTFVS